MGIFEQLVLLRNFYSRWVQALKEEIIERKRAEVELQRAKDAASAANRAAGCCLVTVNGQPSTKKN